MNRSNPALRESIFRNALTGAAAGQMTIPGTIMKAILLIGLMMFSAAWVWTATLTNPALVGTAVLVGALGGLVVALVAMFRPQTSPFTAPLYAVLEGLALGAISAMYAARYRGLPMEAVGLTVMVALGMLLAYRTGLLRATPVFRRVVISATIGIALFYGLTLILGMFGVRMPLLWDNGPAGLVLGLIFAGVAALNLILDFDLIERGARAGAPKYMEWYGAFALLLTLVWLYLEILRLLGNRRQ